MPRLYDCFTFYNELDLLEIRLHELAPVVDRFVLCESTVTFRGKPKPLHFKDNQARFAPFLDKIIHVVVDDMPSGRDIEAVYWKKQKFQRNAIRRGLRNAVPDDLVLLSDLDEIPRASAVESAARHAGPPTVFSFEMSDHRLYVNLGRKNSWNKARMARFGDIRTLEKLRAGGPTWWPKQRRVFATLRQWKRMSLGMRRLRPWVVIPDSGWHFSYMNGPEVLADKFQAVSAVRSDSQVNPAALSLKIKGALARAARPNQEAGFHLIEDNGEFPAHLAANQARFSNLIADRQTFEYYGVEPPPIATSGSNGQRTPVDRPR